MRAAARLDRIVGDILAGRRLKLTPLDASDQEAIRVAAGLAGSRARRPRMSAAFRRRLLRPARSCRSPGRRSALAAGLGAMIGGIGVTMVGKLDGLVTERRRAPAPAVASHGRRTTSRAIIEPSLGLGRWLDTGLRLADMAEGTPYRVSAGAIGAFVVRQGSEVAAMSSLCTHLPCELVWVPDQKLLSCPCHNLTFDADGQPAPLGRQAFPALPLLIARVGAGGRVEVLGTDAPIGRGDRGIP